jgi:hypothetical protein
MNNLSSFATAGTYAHDMSVTTLHQFSSWSEVDSHIMTHIIQGRPYALVYTSDWWKPVSMQASPSSISESVTVLVSDTHPSPNNITHKTSIDHLLYLPEQKIAHVIFDDQSAWEQRIDEFLNTWSNTGDQVILMEKWVNFLTWVVEINQVTGRTKPPRTTTSAALLDPIYTQWILKLVTMCPTLPSYLQPRVRSLGQFVVDRVVDQM